MPEPTIHHLELKEAVLHDRLCAHVGMQLPYTLALSPGRVNLAGDVCSYDTLCREQALVSLAKINFKRFVRAYAGLWRKHDVKVDLAIGINPPLIPKQRVMLASMPAFHAQRLELMFLNLLRSDYGQYSLWSEDFDAYIILGMESGGLLELARAENVV